MLHDPDDPPVNIPVGRLLSSEQWYVFKVTFPTQLAWMLAYFAIICVGYSLMGYRLAKADEHHHPVQDEPLHEKFYSTWYMPDQPAKSCCNKEDCYPTEIKYVGTTLFARRREDGQWIVVPTHKIERHRDNPPARGWHVSAGVNALARISHTIPA